jgi:asparagine synthase (glutamine-hydrolysing)
MGGICGWVLSRGSEGSIAGDPAVVRSEMTRAISHRGPVVWIGSPASGREEPTHLPVGAVDSSFNSQEEVVKAWEDSEGKGVEFASRLHGSFSAALFDPAKDHLVLVRDRLGEKPLYYLRTASGVAFSSEMKALRAAGFTRGMEILPEALDAYLAFTYIPAPWTILEGVRKVPAGHVVELDLGQADPDAAPSETVRCYWRLPQREGLSASPQEALHRLAEALHRRLPGGGGVAAFLSGGLDSSLVVALLRRGGMERIPTFSVGFEERGLDESAHSRRIARLLGTDHHEILLTDAGEDLASRVISQLDEPMADAASLPTWLLAERASGVARTVLTGDGADALLAGDHWFRRLKRLDRLERIPASGRRLLAAASLVGGTRRAARMRDLADLAGLGACERYLRIREKWTPRERLDLYSDTFRGRVDPARTAATYLQAPVQWRRGRSVDAAVRLDSIHGLPEDLLMKVDKMGMAHGVECRSPFLDREWVEWAARLDEDLLVRGGTSKSLLKHAAVSLLPRDLVYRRKQGFRVPMGRWLRGPLAALAEQAFDPDRIRRQGIFNSSTLAALKSRFDSGSSTSALDGRIWQIVAFQTWWRQVFE